MNWPPILYHGTSSRRAERIIAEGIVPNASPTPWPDYPGMEGRVSLTVAYAWYYAAQASGDDEGDPCVVAVDTSRIFGTLLRADDDALGQMVMHRDKLTLAEADKVARIEGAEGGPFANRGAALASLECIGSLSYNGPVMARAIIQAVSLSPDVKGNAQFLSATLEPTITATNYSLLGHHYRALTAYPFRREPVPSPTVSMVGREATEQLIAGSPLPLPPALAKDQEYELECAVTLGKAWDPLIHATIN